DEVEPPDDFFVEHGVDLRGLLSQLISSELDVDRLDYLVRDSYYTGARYGQIDTGWLITHLTRHVDADGRARLALDTRALYAFDDYIIARFHMFVMVYFHQKSIAYEELLRRYMESESCSYRLPADVEGYLSCDDAQLWDHLRRVDHPSAARVVGFQPHKVVLEAHGTAAEAALPQRVEALCRAGIDAFPKAATGVLLRPRKPGKAPIYVVDGRGGGRARLLEDATQAFAPLDHTATISRIYAPPEDVARARGILEGAWKQQSLLRGGPS
ncbi:MAG: HD domain-containing protein, partial [Myxococcota bacterium]|nr:HD domain-containing protein [Myxococcota bacterium]